MQLFIFSIIVIVIYSTNVLFIKYSNNKYGRFIPITILSIADVAFLIRYLFFNSGFNLIIDIVVMIILSVGIVFSAIILLVYKNESQK